VFKDQGWIWEEDKDAMVVDGLSRWKMYILGGEFGL
jgi:hypothetical protein